MKQHTFVVTDAYLQAAPSARLDIFLCAMLADAVSRAQIANHIKEGQVTVSGKDARKPSQLLRVDEVVTYQESIAAPYAVTPQEVEFEVIAEEPDFLVINKPAGLIVHHSETAPEAVTLVHGLLHRYPAFAAFDAQERAGIVHRLDKDTSGLLLVARTPRALTKLAELFQERAIHKTYYALVHGHPSEQGEVAQPIGRHPVHRYKMTIGGIAPRPAHTLYAVVSYLEDHSLLRLNPTTGRTHQLRVHCHYLGHPLVGDAVYGKASIDIKRHALHAASLEFEYAGKAYSFSAPLPPDFRRCFQRLAVGKSVQECDLLLQNI